MTPCPRSPRPLDHLQRAQPLGHRPPALGRRVAAAARRWRRRHGLPRVGRRLATMALLVAARDCATGCGAQPAWRAAGDRRHRPRAGSSSRWRSSLPPRSASWSYSDCSSTLLTRATHGSWRGQRRGRGRSFPAVGQVGWLSADGWPRLRVRRVGGSCADQPVCSSSARPSRARRWSRRDSHSWPRLDDSLKVVLPTVLAGVGLHPGGRAAGDGALAATYAALAGRNRERRGRGRADDIHEASQLARRWRARLPRVRRRRALGDSESARVDAERRGADSRLLDRLHRQLVADPRRHRGARRRTHRRACALRRLARTRRSRGDRLPRDRVLGPGTGRPARVPPPAPTAAPSRQHGRANS